MPSPAIAVRSYDSKDHETRGWNKGQHDKNVVPAEPISDTSSGIDPDGEDDSGDGQ